MCCTALYRARTIAPAVSITSESLWALQARIEIAHVRKESAHLQGQTLVDACNTQQLGHTLMNIALITVRKFSL